MDAAQQERSDMQSPGHLSARSYTLRLPSFKTIIYKARRPVIFALVGCVNTSIDFTVFAILTEVVGVPPLSANVASFLMGATNSFIMNGMLTFRGKNFSLVSIQLI